MFSKGRHKKYWLVTLLLLLFLAYDAGTTLYYHAHIINGGIIIHSHPFKKNIPHDHTSNEFLTINHLTQLHFSNHILSPTLPLPKETGGLPYLMISVSTPPAPQGPVIFLRGPPANFS